MPPVLEAYINSSIDQSEVTFFMVSLLCKLLAIDVLRACLLPMQIVNCMCLVQAKKVMENLQKGGSAGHGYTDAENPFGDTNVTERFVWGKKIEKQLQEGADVRELTSKAERKRQEERLVCHLPSKNIL